MPFAEDPLLNAIIETLSKTPRPLKAREIARLITNVLGRPATKSQVNSILYKLRSKRVADMDNDFRWFLVTHDDAASAVRELAIPPASTEPESVTGKNLDAASNDGRKTECILGKIGYWTVLLRQIPSKSKELYIFQCTLCGYQLQRTSQGGTVSPLSKKGRLTRIGHAKLKHPETQSAQREAEDELLSQGFVIDQPPSGSK